MGMRVRPTSMERVTGTSRITSRLTSRPAPGPPSSVSSWSSAGRASAGLADMGNDLNCSRCLTSSFDRGDRGFGAGLGAADTLLHFHRLAAARHAEAAAKYGHVLGDQRHLAREIARQHIAGLQIEELRQCDRGASENGGELDLRV